MCRAAFFGHPGGGKPKDGKWLASGRVQVFKLESLALRSRLSWFSRQRHGGIFDGDSVARNGALSVNAFTGAMNEFPSLFANQWIFAGIVAVVLLSLSEVGYRIGLNLFAARDEARRSQIGGVQGAMLGLMGLLLGFTFSMALNRYELRRDLVLKEANTIGTTWLRAGLLPEAYRAPAKELLRRFVDVRVKTQANSQDPKQLAEGLRQSAEIENQLWLYAEAAAKVAPTPITATFITTLNEMIDTDSERITAHRNTIPGGVWVLLLLVAASGCLTSAYGSGAQGARSAFTSVFLPLLISVVIMLVFDLMHTHQGFVSISQQPMLDLQRSMQLPAAK